MSSVCTESVASTPANGAWATPPEIKTHSTTVLEIKHYYDSTLVRNQTYLAEKGLESQRMHDV